VQAPAPGTEAKKKEAGASLKSGWAGGRQLWHGSGRGRMSCRLASPQTLCNRQGIRCN
jgi:hypothetical protein